MPAIDVSLALNQVTAPHSACTLPREWGQGRTAFGGVVAGMLTRAMRMQVDETRPLRSLMVDFAGPLTLEQPFDVRADVIRRGKTLTHCRAEAIQDDQIRAAVLAVYGTGHDSQVNVQGAPRPEVPPPDACPRLPYIENVTPAFTRHVAMHWAWGGFPFSGNTSREMGGWMKFESVSGDFTDEHLVALIDCWPPAILPWLRTPAPASSVTWSLDILQPHAPIAADDYLLYHCRIAEAAQGFAVTTAEIWHPDGELLALSRQSVMTYA